MKDTDLIKQKLDVVELVGEYVQLKPSGINHKGLCPFHQEKSPSFMVNRERQSWHCFGCSKGGDIFSFVQDIEGMDFVESLKLLANKAGVQLTNTFEDKAASSQKNRIKEINAKAAAFYNHVLTKMDVSKLAREYLKNRGLKDDTIAEWQIGFVPDQWDLLTQYLLKKGHSIDDLVAAGLTIKKDNASAQSGKGFYDRFRGRIMFPIWDVHGNVVGFTGRILVETEKSGGKYVNTPVTPVYDKSSVVFGLNKAKQEIRKKNLVVMVEGQTDVIACHQAGMKNVVATSGTAFTDQQITLLKRYSENMNMAFDADAAGVKAAKRGIDLAIEQGLHVKVIEIPEGKGGDPDECITQNPDVWFHSVENASPVMDWYFSRAFSGKDISNPREKQEIVDELLPEISRVPFAVEKDHWLQELAGRIGVDVTILRDDMKRIKDSKPVLRENKKVETTTTRPVEKSRAEKLFDRYIMALLGSKIGDSLDKVSSSLFEEVVGFQYYPLYEQLKMQYSTTRSLDIEVTRQFFEKKDGENIVDVLLMQGSLVLSGLSAKELTEEAANTLLSLHNTLKQKKLKELESALQQAEASKDTEQMKDILEKFQALHNI
jgi:DNA primase